MSQKKTRLPLLRNQGSSVKVEIEKINELLTHISTNINELNALVHAGEKLVSYKIGVLLKNKNRNSKP